MIVGHQASINIGLSKSIADAQRHAIQSQDSIHWDRVQRIDQFGRYVIHVRGQQRGGGNDVPHRILSKRLPEARHEDLFVVGALDGDRDLSRRSQATTVDHGVGEDIGKRI